jgi:hypothetical protein
MGITADENISSYHTNVIHLSNYTHAAIPGDAYAQGLKTNWFGQLDRETNPTGTHNTMECLNKDE